METEVELFLYLQLLQCYIVIGLYYTIEEGGGRGWLEDTLIVCNKAVKMYRMYNCGQKSLGQLCKCNKLDVKCRCFTTEV